MKLKVIADQTIVITGASSGIGLTTAKLAASRHANLVLVARDSTALERIASDIDPTGKKVMWGAVDVNDYGALQELAAKAIERFGNIDTWINNAGVSIFGRHEDVSLEDHRRLFDTNYWGVVHGSMAALPHLRKNGGALINLGSELSEVAVPLQGAYSASKHAVKGFTDSLRVELAEADVGVSVTLIMPAAIDTPFVERAKNYIDVQPKLPPPIYTPAIVAEAILVAAQQPRRHLYIGAASKLVTSANKCAPELMDLYLKKWMFSQQRSDLPRLEGSDSLHAPQIQLSGAERGHQTHALSISPYTWLSTRAPTASRFLLLGAACFLASAASRNRSKRK